jgi:teichuronic acid biosynthesis glycosyltransferase TuaC
MKIIVVCSYRSFSAHSDYVSPFIWEQVNELSKSGCKFVYVLAKGGGLKAYIQCLIDLKRQIKEFAPDLIHAHGGLCGFVANMQRSIPVVSTYHGSDVNKLRIRLISKISFYRSVFNIFVADALSEKMKSGKVVPSAVIPCGVNFDQFFPIEDKQSCRTKMGLDSNKHYVLFSKMFYDPIKNYPLAKSAVELLPDTELIEFIGYTREEACLLMNACDAAILTSISEGSPQFIKEAMACNCPIVSVDVGDVKKVIDGTYNCYITPYDKGAISEKLKMIFENDARTNGRVQISRFNNQDICISILNVYTRILSKV